MKTIVRLFALLCGEFILVPGQAAAASELETWCKAEGQSWSANTCTIEAGNHIMTPEDTSLTLLSGESLVVYGTLDTQNALINGGSISNYGTFENTGFDNQGTFNNHGVVNNRGHFKNYSAFNNTGTLNNTPWAYVYSGGTVVNSGAIINLSYYFYNEGTLTNNGQLENQLTLANNGRIENYDALFNHGAIDNSDTIENHGTFFRNVCIGSAITGNVVVNLGTITDLDRCVRAPAVLLGETGE